MKHRLFTFICFWAGIGMVCCQTNDIVFTAACDASEQRYVVVQPPGFNPAQPHDVLMALHGHGSDRWQFVRDARGECRAARDVAAAHGMIYVAPDYRAKTSWMGPKAEADVVQIIGDLKKQYHGARIFLCGGSMGGMASLGFTAMHPDLVAGVAPMNGTANLLEFTNFSEAIADSFGGGKEKVPLEYRKRSAEFWPSHFTMPVGITASGKDTTVPPESVVRLAQALRGQRCQVMLIFRPNTGHSTSYEDAKRIIEFVIQGAPRP